MLSAVQIAGLFAALILLCIYLRILEGRQEKEGLGKADKGNCLGKLQSPLPDPPQPDIIIAEIITIVKKKREKKRGEIFIPPLTL